MEYHWSKPSSHHEVIILDSDDDENENFKDNDSSHHGGALIDNKYNVGECSSSFNKDRKRIIETEPFDDADLISPKPNQVRNKPVNQKCKPFKDRNVSFSGTSKWKQDRSTNSIKGKVQYTGHENHFPSISSPSSHSHSHSYSHAQSSHKLSVSSNHVDKKKENVCFNELLINDAEIISMTTPVKYKLPQPDPGLGLVNRRVQRYSSRVYINDSPSSTKHLEHSNDSYRRKEEKEKEKEKKEKDENLRELERIFKIQMGLEGKEKEGKENKGKEIESNSRINSEMHAAIDDASKASSSRSLLKSCRIHESNRSMERGMRKRIRKEERNDGPSVVLRQENAGCIDRRNAGSKERKEFMPWKNSSMSYENNHNRNQYLMHEWQEAQGGGGGRRRGGGGGYREGWRIPKGKEAQQVGMGMKDGKENNNLNQNLMHKLQTERRELGGGRYRVGWRIPNGKEMHQMGMGIKDGKENNDHNQNSMHELQAARGGAGGGGGGYREGWRCTKGKEVQQVEKAMRDGREKKGKQGMNDDASELGIGCLKSTAMSEEDKIVDFVNPSDGFSCVICQLETSCQVKGVLSCSHSFCFPCIYKWAEMSLKKSYYCPLCLIPFHSITRVENEEEVTIDLHDENVSNKRAKNTISSASTSMNPNACFSSLSNNVRRFPPPFFALRPSASSSAPPARTRPVGICPIIANAVWEGARIDALNKSKRGERKNSSQEDFEALFFNARNSSKK